MKNKETHNKIGSNNKNAVRQGQNASCDINEIYQLVAQEAPVSIMSFDQDGAITFVNQWHLDFFGRKKYGREYFLGRKITTLPGVVSAGIAEEVNKILDGETVVLQDVLVSHFSGGRSGYVTLIGKPIFKNDEVVGGILIREDTTGRKKIENTLKEALAKQEALIKSLPAGVITVDSEFRITDINPQGEKILGRNREEAMGRFCREVLRAGLCHSACPIKKAVQQGSPIGPIDTTVVNQELGSIPVRLRAAGLLDAQNKLVGGVEVFQDISEIKTLERERANIVSMFAHDLKSPLVAIQGLALRLLRHHEESSPEKKVKYLEMVRKGASDLEGVLNDFLDFARMETGSLKFNFSATDLDKEFLELLEIYRPRFSEDNIELAMLSTDKLPVIEADASHLRRAFRNILDNALKYSKPGGKVTLQAKEEPDEVIIDFKDQGVGIDPEELPHIFDMFYRGKDGGKKKGHGLGLAGVKAIVKGHGGKVLVSSELGKGTTFTVHLPKHWRSEES